MNIRHLGIAATSCALAWSFGLGCAGRSEADKTQAGTPGSRAEVFVYTRMPYQKRIQDIVGVAQALSHVVIAYRGGEPLDAISGTPFVHLPQQPGRTRAEARALCLRIAGDIERDPQVFEQLAARFSDDRTTATQGGAFGVQQVTELPYEYVDALYTLAEGEVSRVFETSVGFHIVRRLPIPNGELSLGALMVKYDGVQGYWRPGRQVSRTRDEAAALAAKVARQARSNAASFQTLAARYSDELTFNSDGDMGRWSTRDIFFWPPALVAASRLEVGAVSEPIDTPLGFVVMQRRALAQEVVLAASAIVIGHEESQLADVVPSRTVEQAKTLAQELAATVAREPARFRELQEAHCQLLPCQPHTWRKGHDPFGFEEVTSSLAEGEIATSVEEGPLGFVILRREPLAEYPLTEPELRYELPEVKPLGVAELIQAVPGEQLAMGLLTFARRSADALELSESERARFMAVYENAAIVMRESEVQERQALLAANQGELRQLLGDERFAALGREREAWLRELQGWDAPPPTLPLE